MLILFDIDGTLLLSHRAGANAMIEAGRRLVGPHFSFEGVEIAGRLDTLIWADAAAANGVADPEAVHDEFRATYAALLEERFRHAPSPYTLPGIVPLVEALARDESVTLGLLTGNYPETGLLKIRAAGLDPDRFPVSAWGDDGGHRRDLVPVAMRRYEEWSGRPIAAADVLVVGDTPHDVDCARHHGCRVIAVATGPGFDLEEIEALEPDLALADLSDTEAVLGWILDGRSVAAG